MYKYEFKKRDCWYKQSCKKFNTEFCNHACLRYMEVHYLMAHSNLPKNRQYPFSLIPDKRDIQAFYNLQDIKNDVFNFVRSGNSLYIFSENVGNGKTSWAIKLMQQYFDKVWMGNSFTCRGLFIHTPTFITKIKNNISNNDREFEKMRDNLLFVDLVIWDDVASAKVSDFDYTNLLTYIDQRILSGLSNIYTGNMDYEGLGKCLGDRLQSRVWNDSVVVEFVGDDRRKHK